MNDKMSFKEISDVLAGIESRYPVNKWKIDGIELWPSIRFIIINRLVNVALKQSFQKEYISSFKKILTDVFRFYKYKFYMLLRIWIIRNGFCDIVALKFKHYEITTGPLNNYDRMVDTVCEYLSENGKRSLYIRIGSVKYKFTRG